jgi:hypothetical protein
VAPLGLGLSRPAVVRVRMPEGLCCDHLEPAGLPDGIPQRGLAVQALPCSVKPGK